MIGYLRQELIILINVEGYPSFNYMERVLCNESCCCDGKYI